MSLKIKKRESGLPTPIPFDEMLPVTLRLPDIRKTIEENQVVVVCGETGSGKSTQLPKLLLQMGYGLEKRIGHTQPRRIAARSVAARVAEELSVPLGQQVGCKIRFADNTGDLTCIKLMTDGILLAEIQNDQLLKQYDAIILDEAHERSLNIDLLIGVLKQILTKRADLRLILTSATIDADRIANHFAIGNKPAPIISVSGRTFPVDTLYRPFESADEYENESNANCDVFSAICDAVKELQKIDRGDVLIFLPTEQDIRLATKRLRGFAAQGELKNTEILPLYARLSNKEQNRIFQPGKQDRLILSTNVAESSLTVPRIKHVIDTGTARTSRYSPKSKVQRLPIEPISQASANQRAGRCGRLGPGTCIRLYSETDFQTRDQFSTPEIRRTNLASVILQAKLMRLGDLESIPFLDAPRPESVRDGYKTLFEVGAVDDRRQLTPLGKKISRLPIDPRLARMIVAADDEGALADVLVIAAALEIRDPRERPPEHRQAADEAHERFRDEASDFVGLLKLWDFFHELKSTLSHSKFRKACQKNFLSYNRIREWQDVQRQLRKITQEIGLKPRQRSNDYGKIHRSLLTGLLSGIATKSESYEFNGAGGGKFFLWPGSSLFKKPSKWIMASEMVETERRYLRNIAKIDPGWIEPIASHLLKRNYSEPHFSKKNAACMAYEKVLLFGLPIVTRRSVHYGAIDPKVARDIFIEQGLVEGGYAPEKGVIAENNQVILSISSLANKTRDRDLVFEPALIEEFYQERLPNDLFDGASLQRFLKNANQEQRENLQLKTSDLITSDKWTNADEQFPEEMSVGNLQIPIKYRFEPGGEDDGITMRIPSQAIRQLNPRQVDWLVPGMLTEKITALIRSLPKSIRRNLVPAPDTAERVARQIEFGKGIFIDVVASHLSRIANETISPADFKQKDTNKHLNANFEVIDEKGEVLAKGRDLMQLRSAVHADNDGLEAEILFDDHAWNQKGLTTWEMDSYPESIEVSSHPISVLAYPAIMDRGDSIDLAIVDSASNANRFSQMGLTRLYAIAAKKHVTSQVRWLPDLNQMQLHAASYSNVKSLKIDLHDLIAKLAFVNNEPLPRAKSDFEKRLDNAAERTSLAAQDIARVLPKLFQNLHDVSLALTEKHQQIWRPATDDIRQQLDQLLVERFLVETPWKWLTEFPRFFKAILHRLEKLPQRGVEQDRKLNQEIMEYQNRYETRKQTNDTLGIYDDELEHFRWMIEEFRVGSFAQSLGTSVKVSPQRLEKQWQKAMESIAMPHA